jgi:hypothetical protein
MIMTMSRSPRHRMHFARFTQFTPWRARFLRAQVGIVEAASNQHARIAHHQAVDASYRLRMPVFDNHGCAAGATYN